MAKVRWNKKLFTEKINKSVANALQRQDFSDKVGEFLVDRVKSFGKVGRPLNDKRKFPALEESTIKNRKRLARYNSTDRVFRPRKSNLTFTGQLWDSLKFKANKESVAKGSRFKWNLFFKGSRDPIVTSQTGNKSRPITNERLVDILANEGVGSSNKKFKPFTKLDEKAKERIRQLYRRSLREELSNRFKK